MSYVIHLASRPALAEGVQCARRSPTLVTSAALHAVVDQRPEANRG
jgi:hypothetical protein